ncbi:phospholipid scramblase 3-like [Dermacentor albipictus]|uniref:phospholipid scramblase 3-like n=1 Tax=Dermacentor albipictus TaxID=60249 RepID=UPI0038FC632F
MPSRQASKPASQPKSRPTSPPAQPAVPRPAPSPIPPPVPRPAPPRAPLPAPAPAAAPGGSPAPKPTATVPNTAMAGTPTTGMPEARMPVAGMPMAGMPVAGSYMDALRPPYVQMPTPGLAPPAVPIIPCCPRGLEYLVQIDHLLVHQAVQLMEVVTSWEMQNKYVVKNTMGQFVFMAIEESGCCQRQCCGNIRSFQMTLLDYRNVQVLRLFRPLRCECSCLCCCCLQEMDVRDASMTMMGFVRMECTIIFPNFSVLDSQGNVVLLIKGPCCTTSICCEDVVFDILARDGVTKLGGITKTYTGFIREAGTDADNFTVTFPLDLDVKIKAVLLGAVFLIDYIYFENSSAPPSLDCCLNCFCECLKVILR